MARRKGGDVLENDNTATEADEAAVYTGTDGAEDQPEADTDPSSTENEGTEGDAPAEAEAEEAAPIDLTEFKETVSKAVDQSSTDGTVGDEDFKAVTEAYRALSSQPDSRKAYKQAREFVEEGMKSNLAKAQVREAVAFMNLQEALVHGAGAAAGGTTRKPADPLEDYVTKLVTVELAASIVASEVPEGVDPEKASEEVGKRVAALSASIDTYRAWLDNTDENKGDAPEVDALLVRAFKVARGRGAKVSSSTPRAAYTGERRNVGTHIQQVFAAVEPGTFLKVSAIAKAKSSEYGDDSPSAGAINAKLKSAKGLGIDGLEVVTQDGALGVIKNA